MSDQRQRVALGTVQMKNGQYGEFLIGKIGMADIIIRPTKNDPDKWLISLLEPQGNQPNRGYGGNRGQQQGRHSGSNRAPQRRDDDPVHDNSPMPEEPNF